MNKTSDSSIKGESHIESESSIGANPTSNNSDSNQMADKLDSNIDLDNDDDETYLSMEEEEDDVCQSADLSTQHRLKYKYCFWFSQRSSLNEVDRSTFSQKLIPLGSFETIEQFWSIYAYLIKSDELPVCTDFYVFREGIQPLWEDKANLNGCNLKLHFRCKIAARIWEDLMLAMLGEQFEYSEEICGIVYTNRRNETISLWLRTTEEQIIEEFKRKLSELLGLSEKSVLMLTIHSEKINKSKEKVLPKRLFL